MKFKALLIFAILTTMNLVSAHEGHNKTPGTLSAPHGGQIKGTNELYIEIVSDQEGVKIYPLTHEMKSLSPKQVQITATIQFPKKSQHEKIKLLSSESYYSAQIDSKGMHRYSLELAILFANKRELLKFNVEPQ